MGPMQVVVARNIDHYSPAEATRLSTAALEVLATRLAHEFDARDWDTPGARRETDRQEGSR